MFELGDLADAVGVCVWCGGVVGRWWCCVGKVIVGVLVEWEVMVL